MNNEALAQLKAGTRKINDIKSDTIFFKELKWEGFGETEEVPRFPGDIWALTDYIMKNGQYPQKAIDDSITGIVLVQFMVDIDGSTDNIQVLKGVRNDLDEECIRLVKEMPNWKPGKRIQHAEKGYYWGEEKMGLVIPFRFSLDTLTNQKGNLIKPKSSTTKSNNDNLK